MLHNATADLTSERIMHSGSAPRALPPQPYALMKTQAALIFLGLADGGARQTLSRLPRLRIERGSGRPFQYRTADLQRIRLLMEECAVSLRDAVSIRVAELENRI